MIAPGEGRRTWNCHRQVAGGCHYDRKGRHHRPGATWQLFFKFFCAKRIGSLERPVNWVVRDVRKNSAEARALPKSTQLTGSMSDCGHCPFAKTDAHAARAVRAVG